MLDLHVPKLPTSKVLVGVEQGWSRDVGYRRLQMLLLHVACCMLFPPLWLCGKLNVSVVWLTDDKDWSGLADGSNGLGTPPLSHSPLCLNMRTHAALEGEWERERGERVWARERAASLDNLGEASLLLLGMFTVLQACRQQLLLESRAACCRHVYNVNAGWERGKLGEARASCGCLRHV